MGAYVSAKANFFTLVFLVFIGIFGGIWFADMLIQPTLKFLSSFFASFNDGKLHWLADLVVSSFGLLLTYLTFRYSIGIAMLGGLRAGWDIGGVRIPLTGGQKTPSLSPSQRKTINDEVEWFKKNHTYGWNLCWRPKTKIELLTDERVELALKRAGRYKKPYKFVMWKAALVFIAVLYFLEFALQAWQIALPIVFAVVVYIDTRKRLYDRRVRKQVEKEMQQKFCPLSPTEGLAW